ncbi:hypothetical protein B0A55_06047 [Friedmanniomyces simplex]|uniref:FAD dependent oxidoreductase domain-containing protein n=1 Tax=Friedmanniomyces simplex TaxID=329884 RepID=A0A4U0XAJ3_9PEZI|nr:hypothetical protein B0A55_06047 [Friedmanniomyces simplex]
MAEADAVVILGGGIIGFSIAYYLSQDPHYKGRIHVVDAADRLFESASGYAGGFLARDCDIIVAAGCWTPRVWNTLFPASPVEVRIDGLAGHSVIYRTPRYTKPFLNAAYGPGEQSHGKDQHISYAIYCPPTRSWTYSPEAYARLDGDGKPEIWIGGLNDNSTDLPFPDLPTDSKKLINPERLAELRRAAVQLTGMTNISGGVAEDDLEVVSEALCFRPISQSGVPIIQHIPHRVLGHGSHGKAGAKVWIASGHGPWGISMSLGTGAVMSDMISGRKPSVDVSGLSVELPASSKL